ncbi:MAG: winged helix-turn-helix transcriptional regulator [Actinobacteria bacterium]|nr:winged helix-turn-helix transcriptional regulator [Actinomycetota bacterium]
MQSVSDKSATSRLDDDAVEALTVTLRALADPTRIRLIEELDAHGPESVGGLAACLPLTRQAVSRQLCVLHHAGIVARRREGMHVVYELRDWTGLWLLGQLAESLTPPAS